MEKTREQSEFNMAVSYLNRLNLYFYMANESAVNLNAHGWFYALLVLFRELSTEMNDTELTKCKDDIKKINESITKASKSMRAQMRQEITSDCYDLLQDFELFLRKITKSSGLQLKMKQDPRAALG